jgi:transcription-repair coupling factor (superfamily II helicase)
MQDLEIRGAGAVLGEKQSGDIQAVGFSLYSAMLKRAVTFLKKGLTLDLEGPLNIYADVNLHSPSFLPENYCSDIHERLVLYKRLASCETEETINMLEEELIDRFGLLPEPAKILIASTRIACQAKAMGIMKINASDTSIIVQFISKPSIDPLIIVQAIQVKENYRLINTDKLRVKIAMPHIQDRILQVNNLLKELRGYSD